MVLIIDYHKINCKEGRVNGKIHEDRYMEDQEIDVKKILK
jgi:hypothetical protein